MYHLPRLKNSKRSVGSGCTIKKKTPPYKCFLLQLKGNKTPGGDLDWRRSGQSIAPSRSSSPPHLDETPFVNTVAMRKLSQIPRQHSYDDDTTVGIGLSDSMNLNVGNDCGPGIPLISRRYINNK